MSLTVPTGGVLILPQPEQFEDWRDWARSVNATLADLQQSVEANQQTSFYRVTHITPDSMPEWPEGYTPLWMSLSTAQLFLANPDFDPPTAPDIVYIDTQAIAAAAIETGNIATYAVISDRIANSAVGTVHLQTAAVNSAIILDLAVGNAEVADLAVTTEKIGLAAIVSALIGDLQVVVGKIGDLAVNNGKMANLAVTGGKIANLSVGAEHVLDAAIVNAKIGDTIQSATWNPSTKAGWRINKLGDIEGRSVSIYDNTGTLVFNAGGQVEFSRILNAGDLAALDLVSAAQLVSNIFTALNISTYISSGAIGTALIGTAAIVSALIADLAVGTAKIADLAVTSAKVNSLIVDKISSGQLDAEIAVGDGTFSFIVGASALYFGNGFGTSNQFFLWYGPSSVVLADADESIAIVYFKTDGSAYFGGALNAGVLKNAAQTSDTGDSAVIEVGDFGTLGHDRSYAVSYGFTRTGHRLADTATVSGTTTATFKLEQWNGASWDELASQDVTGSITPAEPSAGDPYNFNESMGGSITYTDFSHTTDDVLLRARLTARALRTVGGTSTGGDAITQRLGLVSIEE